MTGVLGIIGAGKVGTTIGRLASDAGWQVLITDASDDPLLGLTVSTLVPEARLTDMDEVTSASDIVLLAIPLGASEQLDYSLLDDRIVIDAMNHWEPVDGSVAALDAWQGSTSSLVASRNPRMRLVKTLNHLGYHEMTSDARSPEVAERRAVAIATDDAEAGREVAALVSDLGFDPLVVPFDRATLLEPEGPVFGKWIDRGTLSQVLG